jgi:hypothetical protein
MRCDSCGAAASSPATNCEYCNSPLPSVEPEKGDRTHQFAKVRAWEQSSAEQLAGVLDNLPQVGITGELASIIVGVFFAVFGFGAASQMRYESHAPAFMMLLFAGFGCLGLAFILGAVVQLLREFSAEPLERPAVVIAKRSETSGGGEDQSITNTHFATFEFEDGQRESLEVDGHAFGELVEEDAGLLITKVDKFAKFVRVV